MRAKREIRHIAGIGEILFERSRRARRVNISLHPERGIRVAVPYGIGFRQAERFVHTKKEWISRSRRKLTRQQPTPKIYTESDTVRTRRHVLKLVQNSTEQVFGRIGNGTIEVQYPRSVAVSDPDVQLIIRKSLIEAYRIEAKLILPPRVARFAEYFGFDYARVFIKNMKTRWGSCSGRRNINLNLHLMRLPDELIDYVILHELVHTEIRNHSPQFWQRLESLLPDCQQDRRRLKEYPIVI